VSASSRVRSAVVGRQNAALAIASCGVALMLGIVVCFTGIRVSVTGQTSSDAVLAMKSMLERCSSLDAV
jgi:hypothetical protein